jgi:cytosine/uracil/thiamine/allantoin permease
MRADEASVAAGVLDVEMSGAEPIPADRRHGRPRSLFTLWFGANVQFATLSVGALSTSVFGLDFLPAAIAIVLGTVISACLIGLLSTPGAQTGLVQLIQTRAPFGWFGNLPAAAARLPRLRPRSARRGQHLHQHRTVRDGHLLERYRPRRLRRR